LRRRPDARYIEFDQVKSSDGDGTSESIASGRTTEETTAARPDKKDDSIGKIDRRPHPAGNDQTFAPSKRPLAESDTDRPPRRTLDKCTSGSEMAPTRELSFATQDG
jgi:hypothetical protein